MRSSARRRTSEAGGRPSAMQLSSLSRICDAYRDERCRLQFYPRKPSKALCGVRREQLGALLGSSGRGEGLESGRVRRKRSVGRSSFSCPLGKVLARCTANKTSVTPLWSRSQTRNAWAKGRRCKRDHKLILTRSVTEQRRRMRFGEPRSLQKISETRQMPQREKRQEVRRARSVAQGDLEAVGRHAKVWTTW